MNRANFENQIKEKLHDHETDVPPLCWEAIEAQLPAQKGRRRALWWIGASVAAVALVLIAVDFLTNDLVETHKRQIVVAQTTNVAPLQAKKSVSAKSDISVKTTAKSKSAIAHVITRKSLRVQEVFSADTTASISEVSDTEPQQAVAENDKPITMTNAEKEIEAFIQEGISSARSNNTENKRAQNESSAIRLMAGLSGESNDQMQSPTRILRTASANTGEITKMLNSATLTDEDNSASTRFSVPLSFGLMVEKRIWRKLTIETGLYYSYLRSEQDLNSSPYNGKQIQELHYLGIPVRLGYDIVRMKQITVYCKAGGRVEKNIAGRWREAVLYNGEEVYSRLERDLEDKLQWSATFSPGVNMKLIRNFHIYAETPLSYYIDNHSSIVNIRKARNLEFSLQLGLRAVFTTN